MHELSTDDVRQLAAHLDVAVADGELETIGETVQDLLAGAQGIYAVPLSRDDPGGVRAWREPADDPHNALAHACSVDREAADGPLSGLQVGVKDAISVAGVPMEAGSAVLRGFVPQTDATVVARLLDAGATVAAKTNLDEFGGSARGTTARSGPITNPHDDGHTAGGSSGGSAVAVATDRVDVALGSDTGGSIRIPASFCGVVGLKPTYGLVPLDGVVENTYSQDHVGPLARTVREAARTLEVLAGPSEGDLASLAAAGREEYRVGGYARAVERPPDLADLRIGLLEAGVGDGADDAVADRTAATLDRLADAGADVRTVSVEGYEHFRAVKNVLSVSAIAAHWRADAAQYRRGGHVDPAFQATFSDRRRAASAAVGPFYKSKLLAGAHVLIEDGGKLYARAQRTREVLRGRLLDALADVDVLAGPTTPSTAPPVAEAADPGFDYGLNTRPANVARLPAVSLPNGAVDGLPIGLQLVGGPFAEADLLGAAAAVSAVAPEA